MTRLSLPDDLNLFTCVVHMMEWTGLLLLTVMLRTTTYSIQLAESVIPVACITEEHQKPPYKSVLW